MAEGRAVFKTRCPGAEGDRLMGEGMSCLLSCMVRGKNCCCFFFRFMFMGWVLSFLPNRMVRWTAQKIPRLCANWFSIYYWSTN